MLEISRNYFSVSIWVSHGGSVCGGMTGTNDSVWVGWTSLVNNTNFT